MDPLRFDIQTTGQEKLDEAVKKLERGQLTLKEITQLKKDLNETFRSVATGTAEWQRYATQLAKVNDFQRDVRIATRAGHEEYFRLGVEVRQLTLASGLLTGNLGTLANTLGSSMSAAVGLKQALVPLNIQMGALGMGVTALIVGLPQVIKLYDELSKKSKLTYGSQSAFLSGVREQARTDFGAARARVTARFESLRAQGDTEAMKSLGIMNTSDLQWFLAELKRIFVLEQKERRDAADKTLTASREFDKAVTRMQLERAQGLTTYQPPSSSQPGGSLPPGARVSSVPTSGKKGVSFDEVQVSFDEMFTFIFDRIGGMQAAFQASIQVMSRSVGDWLYRAFERTFNGVNSLIEQMVATFAVAILEMATQAAAMWFLTQVGIPLPMLTEAPADGGQLRVQREDGMNRVVEAINSLQLRVDSRGLYLANEQGRIQFGRTSL